MSTRRNNRYLKKTRRVSIVEMGNLRTHRLTVENIGPIRRADVELRPFTVLIGKNNVGKSYFAMLVYALYGAHRGSLPYTLIILMNYFYRYSRIVKRI
jgi:predicted ATPase